MPQVDNGQVQVREHPPEQRQRDADDVPGVAVDAVDERSAQAVDAEGSGEHLRLATGNVGSELGFGWLAEPDDRARDGAHSAAASPVDQAVAGA